MTVVYLLATARLLVIQCQHVMFWIVLTRMSGLKYCCDSAVVFFFFFLIQFLSGWTESSRESRPLHWEACCICSHGKFTEVPACVSTCILSVFIWEIFVILCLQALLLILLCCGFMIKSSMFGVSAKVMWSCLRFMFNRARWHTLLPAPFFIPHHVTCVVQSWQYLKDADQQCNSFSLLQQPQLPVPPPKTSLLQTILLVESIHRNSSLYFPEMKLKAYLIPILSLLHTFSPTTLTCFQSAHNLPPFLFWIEHWKHAALYYCGSVRCFSGSAWTDLRCAQTCQTSVSRRKLIQRLCQGKEL